MRGAAPDVPEPPQAAGSGDARPSIAVVSTHYYDRYLVRSLRHLRRLCEALRPQRCVLVANAPSLPARMQGIALAGAAVEVVEHDNAGMEFGAYQAGVDRVMRDADPDWLVVVNDTFAIHQSFPAPMLRSMAVHIAAAGRSEMPMIVGQVESLPRSYRLEGLRTHRWITTNVFALNRAALRVLEGRLFTPWLEKLVPGAGRREAFFAPRLDPVLVEHLGDWLFEPGATGWYGAAPLNDGNAARYAAKARSILQEKWISARLDAAGAFFADIRPRSLRDRAIGRAAQTLFSAERLLRSRRER